VSKSICTVTFVFDLESALSNRHSHGFTKINISEATGWRRVKHQKSCEHHDLRRFAAGLWYLYVASASVLG
jgi:hypothetical protein